MSESSAGFSLRAPQAADVPLIGAAAALHLGPAAAARLAVLLGTDEGRAASRAVFHGERVLAHVAAEALPYLVRGEPRIFGRLAGVFVEPSLRLRGVHGVIGDLLHELFVHCDGAAEIVMVTARCSDGDAWWLRRHAGFEPIATGLGFERVLPQVVGLPPDTTVQRFGAAEGPMFPATPVGLQCALVRSAAWAHDLVASDPGLEVHLAMRGGIAIGSVVVRATADERRLLDWSAPTGDWHAALALLNAVVGDARLPVRCTLWNPSYWTAHVLQEVGFTLAPRQHEPLLLARTRLGFLTRHFLAEHHELFPLGAAENELPPFTRGEIVVTPPPAGDRGNPA